MKMRLAGIYVIPSWKVFRMSVVYVMFDLFFPCIDTYRLTIVLPFFDTDVAMLRVGIE